MAIQEKPAIITKLVAGGLAGASETILTYPAEYVKTRRQLPQHAGSSLAILRSTLRTSGFSGLYSGCGALALSNSMKSGIRFLAFESSKDALDRLFSSSTEARGNSKPWVSALAGLSAGVAESLAVVTPGEVLKTRMVEAAASKTGGANPSLTTMARTIIREEGVMALWRGAVPVMSKQGTNSAVRFTTFGALQEELKKRYPDKASAVGPTLAIGAMSGVVTVYASMPFDNIKTRMQSANGNYASMLDCLRKILFHEGIKAFWRGTSPRLFRLTLSSSITFTVYSQVVDVAKKLQYQNPKTMPA